MTELTTRNQRDPLVVFRDGVGLLKTKLTARWRGRHVVPDPVFRAELRKRLLAELMGPDLIGERVSTVPFPGGAREPDSR